MKTIYETLNGQISDSDFQTFVEKVKEQGSAATPVKYVKLEIKGSKRLVLYDGAICLDKECGCGGW